MSDTLNESTAVAIGCIIGSTILIIFGLLLWYHHSSRNIRERHIQTHSAKYESIPNENDHITDNEAETELTKTTTMIDIKQQQQQTSDQYISIPNDEVSEDCKEQELDDTNFHIFQCYERNNNENDQNELTHDSDSTSSQQIESTETIQTAESNNSLDEESYDHEKEFEDAKLFFEAQESEYPLVKEWLDGTEEINEIDKLKYFHMFIMKDLTEYDVIYSLNEDDLIEIGIEDCNHRREILFAINGLNNGENESFEDSELYQEGTNDSSSEKYMEGSADSNDDDENGKENEENLLLFPTNACGKQYDHTIEFDDTLILKTLNLSRTHLHKIRYWQSNNSLIGIQCEWHLYNDEGEVIESIQSEQNDKFKECDECVLGFNDFLFDPITIYSDDYVHSLSAMSYFENGFEEKVFGTNRGSETCINIPSGKIVIGFHGGGVSDECIHNLGVITIPYKCSINYDLVKLFLKRYDELLSDTVIECILDFVFCFNDDHQIIDDDEDDDEETKNTEQPVLESLSISVLNQAKTDAQCLHKALYENDEDKLVEISGNRNRLQRISIREAYESLHESELIMSFESELNEERERELLCSVYQTSAEYDVKLIQNALLCDNVDYDILIEVICTRTPMQLNKIKQEWNKMNKTNDRKLIHTMDDVLFYGNFKNLMLELLTGDRQINKEPNMNEIAEWAKSLMNNRQKIQKRQQQIIEILSTWSWPCIAALNKEIMKLSEDKTLCGMISALFDGDDETISALTVIVVFSHAPYDYWAKKLRQALTANDEVDDVTLIRCVSSQNEEDLLNICAVFDEKYGDRQTFKQWIESEELTDSKSKIYHRLLLLLCGYNKKTQNGNEQSTKMSDENIANEQKQQEIEQKEEERKKIPVEFVDHITEYPDFEDEHISNLLTMKLPKYISKYMGNRNEYKLPTKDRELNKLERDLRRITVGLNGVDSENRKYVKLVLLKYYELLCACFDRYCLIGGDKDWLTFDGWNNLLADAFVADKRSETCKDAQCKQLYEEVMNVHDNKKHRKNIKSDWNGWWQQNGNNNNYLFKLKQMTEIKLKGFITSFSFCEIDGTIRSNDKHRTKKFIIFYHDGLNKDKRLKCDAILVNADLIKMEWQSIGEHHSESVTHSGNEIERGSFTLSKLKNELSDADNNAFNSVYGLLRYEFFDALLCLSQMKFSRSTHDFKFQSFMKLIQNFLIHFVFDDIESKSEQLDEYKWLFKSEISQSLDALFDRFAQAQNGLLDETEWCLLCAHIFDKGSEHNAFIKGGRPTTLDLSQSYKLAKSGYNLKISRIEFEKALQKLAHKLYKKKPKSKYIRMDYQQKLQKLLSWAVASEKALLPKHRLSATSDKSVDSLDSNKL